MKVKQTYLQRAFQGTFWDMSNEGYDIFPIMPVVFDKLTKSQSQFINANCKRFDAARTTGEVYCKVDHEFCVIEFQSYRNFERIKVRWIDFPPMSIWLGWFIYGAWGSLEGVTYTIGKWMMVFTRRSTHLERRCGE